MFLALSYRNRGATFRRLSFEGMTSVQGEFGEPVAGVPKQRSLARGNVTQSLM